MNKEINHGGYVFAAATCGDWQVGLTVRDHFAGLVIANLAVHAIQDKWAQGGDEWRLAAANEAYKFADAMIEARQSSAS
jgi:hypothetical protein